MLAATPPDRVQSLVLYGAFISGAIAEKELSDPADVAVQRRVQATHADLLKSWGQGKLIDYYAPSVASRLQRSTFATFEGAAASSALIRGVIEATRQMDVRGVLEAISVPTLVLHHADDIIPLLNARILADGIPGAELRILPGRDHMFWVSDFEESVREIERFVTGSRGSASRERALATILFTDIVGSTNRASEMGDSAWRQCGGYPYRFE